MATSAWGVTSGLVAAGALIVSALTFLGQRRRDRRETEIEVRLLAVEESRRGDEISTREQQRHAAQVADVRIVAFRMESPGGAGYSDKVSVSIENRGPAEARNLDLAILKAADRAHGNGLDSLVETTDQLRGYSGKSPRGYYQVPWELDTPRPLGRLAPTEYVILPFWLRYRTIGNQTFRVTWEDGRGEQMSKPTVLFEGWPD
jgi:hypothetical protein